MAKSMPVLIPGWRQIWTIGVELHTYASKLTANKLKEVHFLLLVGALYFSDVIIIALPAKFSGIF